MIKYNASDVIKKAKQLADLENSDFISWNESLTLLNDAYQNIYQKSINKGNNDFVKVITTSEKAISLPEDFYQLKALTLKQDRFTTPIMRRPQNGSFNDLSYDIYNNTIQINGYSSGNIILEYYPNPTTLTLPGEDVVIDLPIGSDETLVGAYKNVYFVRRREEEVESFRPIYGKYYIVAINKDTGDEAKVAKSYIRDDYSISSNILFTIGDYVLFTGENHNFVMKNGTQVEEVLPCIFRLNIVDFSLEVENRKHPEYVGGGYLANAFAFYDDQPCEISIESYLGEPRVWLATIYGKEYIIRDNNIKLSEYPFIVVLSKNMKHAFCVDSEQLACYVDTTRVGMPEHIMGDNLYIRETGETSYWNLYDLGTKKETTLVSPTRKPMVGTVGFNKNTGYGYYYFVGSNKIVVHSFLEDTELNFPNNMYFNYLAYLLALSFKVKQGSDISAFIPLLENAENAFYDSLTRDDWSFTRITNVY